MQFRLLYSRPPGGRLYVCVGESRRDAGGGLTYEGRVYLDRRRLFDVCGTIREVPEGSRSPLPLVEAAVAEAIEMKLRRRPSQVPAI